MEVAQSIWTLTKHNSWNVNKNITVETLLLNFLHYSKITLRFRLHSNQLTSTVINNFMHHSIERWITQRSQEVRLKWHNNRFVDANIDTALPYIFAILSKCVSFVLNSLSVWDRNVMCGSVLLKYMKHNGILVHFSRTWVVNLKQHMMTTMIHFYTIQACQ